MPTPVVPYRIPDWVNPANASVLDSWAQKAIRTLGGLAGVADPVSQVMGLAAAPVDMPAAMKIGPNIPVSQEAGYVYHATNLERLADIAESGKLNTHKPWEFTDQSVWPDGSVKKRAYFGGSPDNLWQFAPEHGQPVILRTAKSADIIPERGTGDLFTEKPVSASALEYYGEDGSWHPVSNLKKPSGPIDANLAEGLGAKTSKPPR